MADERIGTPDSEARTYWAWTELFRTFQVALDPKKLILAAAGIFFMWVGWVTLSVIFHSARSEPRRSDYVAADYMKRYDIADPTEGELRAQQAYDRDLDEYRVFSALAGPNGGLRVEPWHENRGPNPFLLVTGQLGEGSAWRGGQTVLNWLFTEQMPVLIEPLVKFLRPVGLLLNPRVGGVTRLYLLLVTLWTL